MNNNTIYINRYTGGEDTLALNRREAWHYAGYRGLKSNEDPALEELFDQVYSEMESSLDYKVCYRRMDIQWRDGELILPFDCQSESLKRLLTDCQEIILFAATVGLGVDKFIRRAEMISPTQALIAQGLGAERVETLCNAFCGEMKASLNQEGLDTTNRFSPGYGDVPLECQREVFKLLDCNRQIGISLGESLLMTPSKSVTAIFGIKEL